MTDQQPETQPAIPLPLAPKLPFEMKANLAEYRRRLGVVRIVLAIGLSILIWARFGFVAWLISVGIIIATIVIVLTVLSRRKLTVTNESLTFQNFIGRQKTLEWANSGKVYVFANYLDQGFGVMPRVIISDKDGRGFVSLTSLYWNVDDMNLLLAALKDQKLEADWYADMASSAAIAKTLPKAISYYERHPFVIAFGVVGALVVAVTIFVLLTR